MLHHPTLDKLQTLRLLGFLKGFQEQIQSPDYASLSFEDRVGLLVDRELTERQNRRMANRLKTARFRMDAAIEDVDFKQPRGLDKSLILSLASCQWIQSHENLILTGPTGTGKSYIACALGHQACRQDFSTLYLRLPRLLDDLALAKADGRHPRLLSSLFRADLLILDDWGTRPLTQDQRHDLFEIIEDRYARRSTIVSGQLPVAHWHEIIGDPTLADAILDRLVHNAYKITLKGDSMRKKRTAPSATPKMEL
jgi:DNA replication protein DnaC